MDVMKAIWCKKWVFSEDCGKLEYPKLLLQSWCSIFLINFTYSVWYWGQLDCSFVYNVTINDWINGIVSVEYWFVHWALIFKLVLNIEHMKIWFRNGKYVIQQEVIIWFHCSSVTEKGKMNITLKLHASEILLPRNQVVLAFLLSSCFQLSSSIARERID